MSDLGRQIGEAFVALNDDDTQSAVCATCDGKGWYVGHEDACYDGDGCVCSGVQVECDCHDAEIV